MRRLLLLLALLAALFTVAACGGDDDGGDSASKDDAVEEINDICAEAEEDFDELEQELEGSAGGSDTADLVRRTRERLNEGIGDIEDVDAPDEDRDALDEFIEVSEEQSDLLEELATAVEDSDQARIEEVGNELDELEARSDDAAEEYGIDECVSEDEEEGTTEDGTEDGGTTQTKEEVIAEGDRICEEAETEAQNVTLPDDVSGYERFGQETKAIIDNVVAELRGLSPPPEDQETFEQYLGTLEETSAKLEELSIAGANGDEEEANRVLESFQELGSRSDELAQQYGFEKCGESG